MVITYNHENFIRQCIESILTQKTQFAFEIVIGDDASTDGTYDIVRQIRLEYSSKIRLIEEENHVGFIPNYLRTLRYCEGEFLAFCEGDDYWIDPNKLEDQVSFLINNPDYGLIYSDYNTYNESSKIVVKNYLSLNKFIPIEGFQPSKMVKGDNQIMTLTTCIRASLLGPEYFRIMDDRFLFIADFPTWLWLGLKSNIHFEPKTTAVYRVHKKSITNSHSKEEAWIFHRSHNYIRNKILRFLEYVPPNWKEIDCNIQRALMRKSLELNYKQVYGIASLRVLQKHKATRLSDYITLFGLYYPFLTWPVRILLSLIRRFKLDITV